MGKIGDQFEELVEIVSKLRSPEGCPWDREQTNHSLLPYFIEEVYEVVESIDENNWDLLKEELGDVLLLLVFQASIAEDNEKIQILDSLENINKKLVHRHPHVFGDANADAVPESKLTVCGVPSLHFHILTSPVLVICPIYCSASSL